MKLRRDFQEVISRVGLAVLLFLGTLVVFAVFVLSSVLMEWLLEFVVNKESVFSRTIETITEILLLGCGLLVSLGGAIIVLGFRYIVSVPYRGVAMLSSLWALAREKYPFNGRLLLYGAIGGVLVGLFQLAAGEATEEAMDVAKAAGIASFVSITFGIWIGMTLSLWTLRLAMYRLTAMEGKLTAALPSALLEQDQEEEQSAKAQTRGARRGIGFIVTVPLFLLIVAPALTLQALLNLQVGLYDPNIWLPVILGMWVMVLLSLGVQHAQIWSMERRISRLVRTIAQAMDTDDPLEPVQQPQYWQLAMRRVSNWLEWFTGVPVDRGDFEGYPGTVA